MARTLLLDRSAWDLVIDARGNIAVADEPYALAQDVATACRTVQGECWYDTSRGVPYFTQILGRTPSAQVIKSAFIQEALRIPDVASAKCYLQAVENRQLTGQIQVTSATTGQTVAATAPVLPAGLAPQTLAGELDFSDPRQSGLTSVV